MPPIQDRNKSAKSKRKQEYIAAKRSAQGTNPVHKGKTSRGLVRIIAGTHRGRRLPVIVSEGLRPTSDRVKETLFNWLMTEVNGAVCLDMFAGSGSLGIEALSRGADKVVFIEQDKAAAKQVSENLSTLRETDHGLVIVENAFTHDFEPSTHFDLIFIDPPFGKNMVEKSIEKLQLSAVLNKHAYIYIETSHQDSYQMPANFSLIKEIKTSQVFACLFQLNT